ncbi:MAG: aminoglycoside 3'-phosphotransferase [Ruminococcaceae bacterium]|nr:aminoglycoside 3'-phosphotransferase [Oscillospiraceae bacterium]
MKKTLLENIPCGFPDEIRTFIKGHDVYDSSCSPEARVYYIDKDKGYYLKSSAKGALANEAAMTSYFHSKGLGVEVLRYFTDDKDWLLTARAVGEDCTHADYLSESKQLCDTLATYLRELHELDFSDCPIADRNAVYLSTVENNCKSGNYDTSAFPDSFGYRSAEEAYSVFSEGKDAICGRVLLHGDYCLPNIMLVNWRLSAFIDLGNGGVGDRHIDLFWGTWTLWFNLKTTKYFGRFLDVYGRDKADESILKIIAAAEVFG